MKEHVVDDVFAALVPEGMDISSDEIKKMAASYAQRMVWSQWPEGELPVEIRFEPITWLVTNKAEEIDAFQPAQHCQTCAEGNARAAAYLAEHPDRWIVLGNLRYTEVWPE